MKKFLIIVTLLCLLLLCGCKNKQELPYDAQLLFVGSCHHRYARLLTEEFEKDNKIKGGSYSNPEYDGSNDEYIFNDEGPEYILKIIRSKEEEEKIINKEYRTYDIDYEKELLILYIEVSMNCAFYLNDLALEECEEKSTLKIYFDYKIVDSTQPHQRAFLVKIEAIEFDEVIFLFNRTTSNEFSLGRKK